MISKTKSTNKLKETLKQKEREKAKYDFEKRQKSKQKESQLKSKFSKNINGDPTGPIPSIEFIKSMDLDDIDLITERLWIYGLTVEPNSSKNVKKSRKHPRVPKLDLDAVYKMIEKDNEYEDYEEEEDEAEEDWQSGIIILN